LTGQVLPPGPEEELLVGGVLVDGVVAGVLEGVVGGVLDGVLDGVVELGGGVLVGGGPAGPVSARSSAW
jgi:hypothetical protein